MAIVIKRKKSTIISEHSDKPAAPKTRHYVDNARFCEAMVEWKQKCRDAELAGKPTPPVSNEIGKCLLDIANNLAKKHEFAIYHYKNDMICDAIENCMTYIGNFDPEKSKNPFAYFTQICYFAFLRRIQKEKRHVYLKFKSMIDASVFGTLAEVTEEEQHFVENIDVTQEYVEAFIKEYEEKNPPNKKKKAQKQSLLDDLMKIDETLVEGADIEIEVDTEDFDE